MKVKFWGVRGSIACPGPKTVRYGGNTTCIEVRGDNNELIVLDAGTGIFQLSQALLAELPVTANIFITHTHWDHIQGLPLFIPNFIPGNTLRLHGAFDPVTGKGVEQVMSVQLQYTFFPVREVEMKARMEYITMTPNEPLAIGSAVVTPSLLNHPVVDFGYRIDCNGKSLFFTGDHEPPYNIYEPGEEAYAEYQVFVDEKNQSIHDAMRNVDVLIVDCAYTDAEYPTKKGWGHGTFGSAIAMAKASNAKVLYCTHHEPTRSDDALETVFAQALAAHAGQLDGLEVRLAREGDAYEF